MGAMSVEPGHVAIKNLEINFPGKDGPVTALAPTSLDLRPGTFTALIGPSGCGKSTLLNAIAGFVKPIAGTITLDNMPMAGAGDRVGVIFQQYALFPWFTALGNVKFGLKSRNFSRAEQTERAMVALDAQTRIVMHELLVKLWLKHRATVLFVTHDVDEALLLSDDVGVMSSAPGRILKSYNIELPRPRSLTRDHSELLDLRADIVAMLHPTNSHYLPTTLKGVQR